MLTLRCTHKLLKEIHLPKDELPDPGDGFLGSWFGHLFRLERRKCVLFTNDRTRYSVLLYGLKKHDFGQLGYSFLSGLDENLRNDGFSSETIVSIGTACYPIAWGTTNSRSVLGTMNDMIMTSRVMVSTQRQDILAEVKSLNHNLNRTPISTLNYLRPVDELRDVLHDWTP
jgi:hypothetical protein